MEIQAQTKLHDKGGIENEIGDEDSEADHGPCFRGSPASIISLRSIRTDGFGLESAGSLA
jgi:hypothetical protein